MQTNNIINLLNFEGLNYIKSEEHEKNIVIHLKRIDKRPVCPKCGHENLHINEWRIHTVKDLPIHNKSVVLKIHKQRYKCPHCSKKITGSLDMVTKHKQHTDRIRSYVQERLKVINFKECSKEIGVSPTTTIRFFNEETHFESKLEAPKILHIDEFKGNAANEKYQLGLVDGTKKKVFDILPNRKSRTLKSYLQTLSNSPEIAVIDMWNPYYNVIKAIWPDTVIVADKFHYIRQISWAVRDVRTRIQKVNKHGKRIKKYWKLFMKNSTKLTFKQQERLEELLNYDMELKEMYNFKEIFDKTVSCKTGKDAHENFDNWLDYLQKSQLEEAKKLYKTFTNWYSEIVSSFYYNYTNGIAEGFNNRIKVIKRQSYGIRKFKNLRDLIMLRIS